MNYIDAQLFKAIPMPLNDRNSAEDRNGQIKLKIHTQNGQTNWLNVSPDQMREIEQILNQEVTT
jgi:hypothetical protein